MNYLMDYLIVVLISIFSSYLANAYMCYRSTGKLGRQVFIDGFKFSRFNIITYLLFIVLGIVFISIFTKYNYSYLKIYRYLILAFTLYPISLIDKREQIIPNKLILFLLLFRLAYLGLEIFNNKYMWSEMINSAFLGLAIGGGLFLITYVVARRSIGMGDVKLFGVIGFFIGSANILGSILITLLLTSIVGGGLMILKRLNSKDSLPLAPFAFIGTVISMILGY